MIREHKLKTWPSAFSLTEKGAKDWEFRKNDRDFAVGDILVLEFWDPSRHDDGSGTNRGYWVVNDERHSLRREITAIVHGPMFAIPDRYCILSTIPALLDVPVQTGSLDRLPSVPCAAGQHETCISATCYCNCHNVKEAKDV